MYDNWASDLETNKYVSYKPHQNYEETKEIINNWISEYENGWMNWVVELKENHEIIGNIEVIAKSKKHNNCEVGYTYGSKFWGKGYATEVLKRVIEFLLFDCDFHLVEARHHASNPASGRVMEKAGMKKDGVLRERRVNKLMDGYDENGKKVYEGGFNGFDRNGNGYCFDVDGKDMEFCLYENGELKRVIQMFKGNEKLSRKVFDNGKVSILSDLVKENILLDEFKVFTLSKLSGYDSIIEKMQKNVILLGEHFRVFRGMEHGRNGNLIKCPHCNHFFPLLFQSLRSFY